MPCACDQAAVVFEHAFRGLRVPLVAQHDGQAGIEEGQFAQPPLQNRQIEIGVREGGVARLEGHLGPARPRREADHLERRHGVAALETDKMHLAVAPDFDVHPFGQRVDHGGADAVQAAGHLVGVLVELAAGVQPGQHHLGGGDAFLVVDVGRDAAAVVAHGDAAVPVQRRLDAGGEAGLRLVDRVVDDLEGHVMQAGAVIGVADIHARALAHGIEPAQHRNGGSVVGVRPGRVVGGRRGVVTHAGGVLR